VQNNFALQEGLHLEPDQNQKWRRLTRLFLVRFEHGKVLMIKMGTVLIPRPEQIPFNLMQKPVSLMRSAHFFGVNKIGV
jgi:hypothetical protein